MMLVKHILLVGMLVMGFWFNVIMRVGPMMSSNTGVDQAISRFRWYVNVMAISGVLVLLLTALAQAK
jgi:putative copper export protein